MLTTGARGNFFFFSPTSEIYSLVRRGFDFIMCSIRCDVSKGRIGFFTRYGEVGYVGACLFFYPKCLPAFVSFFRTVGAVSTECEPPSRGRLFQIGNHDVNVTNASDWE